MAYQPQPGYGGENALGGRDHLTHLINGHHQAMLSSADPNITAAHSKHLAMLTALQAKQQAGRPQGGPGGPVAEPGANPEPRPAYGFGGPQFDQTSSDAEGAAGASALLAALFPPRQITAQNAVNPAVLAGAGGMPPPQTYPHPLNPILAALLGHGAVGG